MIIRKDELVMTRLREKDIEMVRKWRNCPEIRQFMEYREHITPKMQKEWFRSVDNINNLYCVMHYNGKAVGLCNVKNIDWDAKTMEAGVFIWDKDHRASPIPVVGFLIMAELIIVKMNLSAQAHVLKTNKRAINFNKSLGFVPADGQENVENQLYKLTRETYLQKAGKLRRLFKTMKTDAPAEIVLEEHDYQTGFGAFMESLFKEALGEPVATEEGKVFRF